MTNKTEVILAKASWCPHCVHFMPIFEKSSEDYGNKYKFSYYDFADDAPSPNKDNFENDHAELSNSIEGYPTIFLKTGGGKHTQISPSIIKNNDINKAVKDFINNIENGYKSLLSDGKIKYINLEGGFMEDDFLFKNKYMKYKQKYLKLKNNFN